MSRCAECRFAHHEQFAGYPGRWMCQHPYRDELDNSGHFTYPKLDSVQVVICETEANDLGDVKTNLGVLREAKTPVWCYDEAVRRERERRRKTGEPPFDPARQRRSLGWPEKTL